MSEVSIEDTAAAVEEVPPPRRGRPKQTPEARSRSQQKARQRDKMKRNWPFTRPLEDVIWATEEDLKIWRLEIEQRYELLMEIRKLLAATGG